MHTGWKVVIGIAGIGLLLKLWSDSQKLANQMKGNPTDTKGEVTVGGVNYPTKAATQGINVGTETDQSAQTNQDANPSTSYGNPFWNPYAG